MSFRLYFRLAWIKVGIFGNLQRFPWRLRRRRRGRKLLLSSFFIITFILPIHGERGVFAGVAELQGKPGKNPKKWDLRATDPKTRESQPPQEARDIQNFWSS